MKQCLLSLSLLCGMYAASNATIVMITASDFQFAPNSGVTINVGDTVMFMWSNGDHTATSVNIPAGAATFDAPLTSTNTSFMYVPTVAGNYTYTCTPHIAMGMNGQFMVNPSTGVAKVAASLFSMYPNPAATTLHVSLKTGQTANAMLYDMAGRTILTQSIAGSAAINVANLPNGTYFLRLEQNGDIATQTVVVSH